MITRLHEIQTIATDVPVKWYVCKSVCLAVDAPLRSALNGSRSCLEWKLLRSKSQTDIVLDGGFKPVDSMRLLPNYFGHLMIIRLRIRFCYMWRAVSSSTYTFFIFRLGSRL